MRVDSYIESLLRKWGKLPVSVYLGYPRQSPCFREYRPKGYREDATDLDSGEVDRLSEFLAENLRPMQISVLRVRLDQQLHHASRHI